MIGRNLGRYKIFDILGSGGMGAVYKGVDEVNHRQVAIKILPPEQASDPERVKRFLREAGAVARLDHPHIVRLYEAGEAEGFYFIVLEYLSGKTLKELLKRAPLPQEQVLSFLCQICAALEHAHQKGIVHRDLKPANIMIDEGGKVKVMDFGLARITDLSALTKSGDLVGTVSYISPEQARGERVDARADLYSLGAILYEMLTGKVPFEGETPVSVIYRHLNEEPVPPRRLNPQVRPALESMTLRLLGKDPRQRFQSARELAQAVERCLEEGGSFLEFEEPESSMEFRPRLVGREKEMAELKGYLEEAIRGQGGLVLIGGEAGVGKTRLVEELQTLAKPRNVNCLAGSCLYQDAPNPYLPFVEVLETYLERGETVVSGFTLQAEIDRLVSRLVNLLPYAGPQPEERPTLKGKEAQTQMFEAVAQLIISISKLRPLFLLLDDLQWASATTLQLLHYLIRNIQGTRILVAGTYRSEELQAKEGHPLLEMRRRLGREGLLREIQLARLTRDDLWQMLGDLFREGGLGEEFLAWLFEETEGNPFFVLEVLRLLRDRGALSKDEAGWRVDERLAGVEIPPGIYDVIARRVEDVGEEQRDLLDCAAVLGRRFDVTILVSVLGGSRLDLLKRLRVLERRHQLITSDDGRYSFTHSKIREMVYHELPPDLRREYHLTIARCIEGLHSHALEEVIYDLAHHYFRGGNAEKALVYSLKAADRAERSYALDEALQFYLAALSILDEGEETPESKGQRIEILGKRGRLLSTLSRREAALESLALALRLCKELGDETRESNLLTEMADLQMRMGNWEQALALCAESMGISRKVEGLRQMARTFSVMGTALFLKGDWEGSIHHYERGLLLSERAGDEVQRARILGNLGNVHDAQGEEGKAIEHYEKAIAILEGEGLLLDAALGYLNLGYAYASLEEWGEAERSYERSLEVFQKVGDVYHTGLAYLHLAETRFGQRELETARGFCDKARELFHKIDDRLGIADTARVLASIHREEREFEVGEECLRQAMEAYEELDDRLNLAETSLELGVMLEERGEGKEASEYLKRAKRLFQGLGAEEGWQKAGERLAHLGGN